MAEVPMKFRSVTVEFGFWEDAPHFADSQREFVDLMLAAVGPGVHVGVRADATHEQRVSDA